MLSIPLSVIVYRGFYVYFQLSLCVCVVLVFLRYPSFLHVQAISSRFVVFFSNAVTSCCNCFLTSLFRLLSLLLIPVIHRSQLISADSILRSCSFFALSNILIHIRTPRAVVRIILLCLSIFFQSLRQLLRIC